MPVSLRVKNLPVGLGFTASATVDGVTQQAVVPSHLQPSSITAMPLISSGQFASETLTVDVSGIPGVTLIEWREVGGAVLGSGSTFNPSTHGGKQIEAVITHDGGEVVSPAVLIYMPGMMPTHNADDANALKLFRHNTATHIAIIDGNWTDPLVWFGGRVPRAGARVLIPHGIDVTYDNAKANIRLDRIRIDGTLRWALNKSTRMLVETLLTTRSGSKLIGTDNDNRLPAAYTADIAISGREYGRHSFVATNIDEDLDDDPSLLGRGIISQGTWRTWGAKKLSWGRAIHTTTFSGGAFTFRGVKAGDTSLTLDQVPTGWLVGNEIIIAGTALNDYGPAEFDTELSTQDETVTITSINGNTIHWSGGLAHDHDNQLPGSTRGDLNAVVMLKGGRNITIRSEVTEVEARRGHTVCMHHHAVVDLWDTQFIGLGRTDKKVGAGIRNNQGQYQYFDQNQLTTLTKTFTSDSNIIARYPVHLHHLGFNHQGARPIVSDCYVEDTPGWGMVHHACDADFFNNGIHDFHGAGMVSESGNELGAWVGNVISKSTAYDGDLRASPKIRGEGTIEGDSFRLGYAYAMRGRAVRLCNNVAFGVPYAYVFHHRYVPTEPASRVFAQAIDPLRQNMDLKETGQMVNFDDARLKFMLADYPITHMAGNEAIATFAGVFVTKLSPSQNHDKGIRFIDFKSWGHKFEGAVVEYIANYAFLRGDFVTARTDQGYGLKTEGNAFAVSAVNCRMEGGTHGVFKLGADTVGASRHNKFSPSDPRWSEVGNDYVDTGQDTEGVDFPVGGNDEAAVTYTDRNWAGTLDFDQNPSENFPLVVATWNGIDNSTPLTGVVTNADGKKTTSISTQQEIAPKPYNDTFFTASPRDCAEYAAVYGYWEYDFGDGHLHALVQHEIIHDPITTRIAKITKLIKCAAAPTAFTAINNGPLIIAATDCVQSNMAVPVATGGSATVDVLAGANGAGGAGTYALDEGDYVKADYGVAVLDYANGELTYTPDRNFSGVDEVTVFVKSQQRYATVRITFLVNDGQVGTLVTPLNETHFVVNDHADAQTIGVQLADVPDTHRRRIEYVQYSTDGGTTWRRLCNGWVKAVHKIAMESDGTAITAGSYNVQIRYKTDFDNATSATSVNHPVAVS